MPYQIKRLFLFFLFTLEVISLGFSQEVVSDKSIKLSVDASFLNNIVRIIQKKDNKPSFVYIPFGDVKLGFTGMQDKVRGSFIAEFKFTDNKALLDIYRAFVRVGLPGFRFTLGKNLFSWGEGTYYNAGDILFLNAPKNNLTTVDSLRDNSRWLVCLYVPIDTYSFFELIAVAPPFSISDFYLPNVDPPSITESGIGSRFLFKLADIQYQAGYFFTGKNILHQPFLSMQGSFGGVVDYTLATSVSIQSKKFSKQQVKENFLISFGLYYPIKVSDDLLVELRLENLFIPLGTWKNIKKKEAIYGHEMFTSLAFTFFNTVITLRNIFSTVDLSAQLALIVDWNLYQGLHLIFTGNGQFGNSKSRYSFNDKSGYPASGLGFSFGARYLY